MKTPKQIQKPVRRRNTLWVLLLATVTACFIAGLYVYPAYQSIQNDKLAAADAESKISQLETTLISLKEANKNPQPTQLDLLLNQQIPASADATELIKYLDSITPYRYVAEGQKTLLKSFNIRDEGILASQIKNTEADIEDMHDAFEGVVPGRIVIQGVLESSKKAFMDLLAELERTDKRLFTVDQLSWKESRSAKARPASEIQYSINIHTYYQAGGVDKK